MRFCSQMILVYCIVYTAFLFNDVWEHTAAACVHSPSVLMEQKRLRFLCEQRTSRQLCKRTVYNRAAVAIGRDEEHDAFL